MSKLPQVSGVQAIQARERPGFAVARQRGGNLVVLFSGGAGCVVPNRCELKIGTLSSVFKQAV